MTRAARETDMLRRYRALPDGETLKEAARALDDRHPALADRLREIAKEHQLETADSRLQANLDSRSTP